MPFRSKVVSKVPSHPWIMLEHKLTSGVCREAISPMNWCTWRIPIEILTSDTWPNKCFRWELSLFIAWFSSHRGTWFQRLQPPRNPAIEPPRITDVTEEVDFWDRKPKPFSPGNGNWKKTLEHLFLNIYNYVKDEQELRELFGWKKFGRVRSRNIFCLIAVHRCFA